MDLFDPLVERLRARILGDEGTTAGLDGIRREITRAWSEGLISDDQYQDLYDEAHRRAGRNRTATGKRYRIRHALKTVLPNLSAPTSVDRSTKTVRVRFISAEERAARDERLRERRRIARLAAWEAEYAAMFTQGEQAALSTILLQIRNEGFCTLAVKAIAARSKVCERVVQTALRKASGWLIAVKRRLRNTSIITLQLQAVRDWWRRVDREKALAESASQPLENPSSLDLNLDPPQGADFCRTAPVVEAVEEPAPAAPEPPPAPKPKVEDLTKTAFDRRMEELNRKVGAATQERWKVDRSVDDWERPEREDWMTSYHRAFRTRWRSYVHLDPKHFPRCFDHMGEKLLPHILAWIRERCGSEEIGWGRCNMAKFGGPFRPRKLWIGFEEPKYGFEFTMNFRGPV